MAVINRPNIPHHAESVVDENGRLNPSWRRFIETVQNRVNPEAVRDYTIASGVVTVNNRNLRIDTEAAAASDNLDTISGLSTDEHFVIHQVADGRDITLTHAVGNIRTHTGASIVFVNSASVAFGYYDGTNALIYGAVL